MLVPLERRHTYADTREFAEIVAGTLARLHRGLVTTEWSKSKRRGVLMDANQNGEGKTIASVYSVRPRAGAPVSTPLRWDEVHEDLDPRRLHHGRRARPRRAGGRPLRRRPDDPPVARRGAQAAPVRLDERRRGARRLLPRRRTCEATTGRTSTTSSTRSRTGASSPSPATRAAGTASSCAAARRSSGRRRACSPPMRSSPRSSRARFLFSEHPIAFEDDVEGFAPLARDDIRAPRGDGISFYHVHAPLDQHPEVAPSRLVAQGIGLRRLEEYFPIAEGIPGGAAIVGRHRLRARRAGRPPALPTSARRSRSTSSPGRASAPAE